MNDQVMEISFDPTTEAFWEAAKQGRLLIQHCPNCDHYQFYPRPFCLSCDSNRVDWKEVGGQGVVYSVTTVRRSLLPGFAAPYRVALVELKEGPRLLTHIVNGPVKIGEKVRVRWQKGPSMLPLPVFEPF